MPVKPSVKTLTATSADVLNAIRNSASQNYRDFVPVATQDADAIRTIGNIIMQYPGLQNEFLSALVNRIGRVIISNKEWSNPWSVFKKGTLEYGETIEDIFVDIVNGIPFDPDVEEGVFKRRFADVRAAFYVLNYKTKYPTTVSEDLLRTAFLSADGVNTLIAKIVTAMYTGAAYDEYQTMKYMLARHILHGQIYAKSTNVTDGNEKVLATDFKTVSNNLEFMSQNYNLAGVHAHTVKDDQYIIINTATDAAIDVNVLATAFNMDKAEFMGHRVTVDGFGNLDIARLNTLFANQPGYEEIGSTELEALNKIPAVIVDRDFWQVYDNLNKFTEIFNAESLYWNYFYHVWRTFAVSPFANAVVFVPGAATVTAVTVTPATATVTKGQTLHLSAAVTTTNFAPEAVNWTITTAGVKAGTTVDNSGNVHIAADETVASITVKATSTFDSTKSGSCTVTIAT